MLYGHGFALNCFLILSTMMFSESQNVPWLSSTMFEIRYLFDCVCLNSVDSCIAYLKGFSPQLEFLIIYLKEANFHALSLGSHHSGHGGMGGGMGVLLAGGAAAAAAAYGAHHLSHSHHGGHGGYGGYGAYGGFGHGKFKHGKHGKFKHGKFKHGKFGKKWKWW